MIAIIDYGMRNLRSEEKAFQFLGFTARIVDNPAETTNASHLVLPGDAAFGAEKLVRPSWPHSCSHWFASRVT